MQQVCELWAECGIRVGIMVASRFWLLHLMRGSGPDKYESIQLSLSHAEILSESFYGL